MITNASWPEVNKAPEGLSREARIEWERLAPRLENEGKLTALDVVAFQGYCSAYGSALRLGREIREAKALIQALEQVQRVYAKQAAAFRREFGILPGKEGES